MLPPRVRIQDVPLSSRAKKWLKYNSFYQIEKLICEAKPMLLGIARHREARDPVMFDD